MNIYKYQYYIGEIDIKEYECTKDLEDLFICGKKIKGYVYKIKTNKTNNRCVRSSVLEFDLDKVQSNIMYSLSGDMKKYFINEIIKDLNKEIEQNEKTIKGYKQEIEELKKI